MMRQASKLALTLLACSMASWGAPALAASHREAPLIALDPPPITPTFTRSSATTPRIWIAHRLIGA